MINQREDTNNYPGTVLLTVLFLLFIIVLSHKSDNQTSNSLQGPSNYESESACNSNNLKAVPVSAIQLPSLEKSCLYRLCNTYFSIFNAHHRILEDNREIARDFIIHQKIRLSIKPKPPYRFYSRKISADTEDLPVLS
jgi:hypothetical protein